MLVSDLKSIPVFKAYLTKMRAEKIMQFVCFETILNMEDFILHWEEYTRSSNSNLDVTLQQSERKGMFRYIAQHSCAVGEFKFVFAKGKRSSRNPEVEIRVKQVGGYSVMQTEKKNETRIDESKVFAFIVKTPASLDPFKVMAAHCKLNIYEPYYENCQYAYILEFFVKDKNVEVFLNQLKTEHIDEVGVYKEFVLQAL